MSMQVTASSIIALSAPCKYSSAEMTHEQDSWIDVRNEPVTDIGCAWGVRSQGATRDSQRIEEEEGNP